MIQFHSKSVVSGPEALLTEGSVESLLTEDAKQ